MLKRVGLLSSFSRTSRCTILCTLQINRDSTSVFHPPLIFTALSLSAPGRDLDKDQFIGHYCNSCTSGGNTTVLQLQSSVAIDLRQIRSGAVANLPSEFAEESSLCHLRRDCWKSLLLYYQHRLYFFSDKD